MFTLEKLVYTVAALRLDVQADENPKPIQLNKQERLHHTLIRPVAVTLTQPFPGAWESGIFVTTDLTFSQVGFFKCLNLFFFRALYKSS